MALILIAGGAGYIGSHVNKELNRRGFKTVVLDNFIYGHREACRWGELAEGDLADRNFLQRVFSSFDIEAVMHFSAFTYVGESVTDPAKYYRNNVMNTLNLLDVMVEYKVKYFVFSSSCAVYGEPATIPIVEELPKQPINPYGRTKLMVENILADYDHAYGLKYAALRYFNAAGADPEGELGEWHDPETHLIPLVLDAALGRRPYISVFGTDYPTPDGTCIRDYIHVNDLADAHIRAMDYIRENSCSEAFNLGSGEGFSVKEVIDMAREVTEKDIQVKYSPRREGDPPRLVGSGEKARRLLSFETKYDLRRIVKTAWNWHQKLNELRGAFRL